MIDALVIGLLVFTGVFVVMVIISSVVAYVTGEGPPP